MKSNVKPLGRVPPQWLRDSFHSVKKDVIQGDEEVITIEKFWTFSLWITIFHIIQYDKRLVVVKLMRFLWVKRALCYSRLRKMGPMQVVPWWNVLSHHPDKNCTTSNFLPEMG